jgi:uncharacterized protein (TIGR03000 family)
MSRRILLAAVLLAVSGPALAQTQTTAKVTIRLPRDARLYVDDVFCPLPGEARSFETPPLEAMKKYYYTLRVEITVEGKPIRVSKRAVLEAGKESVTDFGDREAIIAASIFSDPKEPAPKKNGGTEEKPDDSPAKAPNGLAPEYALAIVKGDMVHILKPVTQTMYVDETRTTMVDGKPVQVTVKVPKHVLKQVEEKAKLENVKAYDLRGKQVASEKVPVILEKETAVLLVHERKLDPFYLRTVKEGTLLLEVRPELVTQAPPMKVPTPPVTPPKAAPASVESAPPMVVSAWFKDGFIIWKEVNNTFEFKDGKDEPLQQEAERKVDAAKSKIKTVGGKTVTVDELSQRLAKPTPVVVSLDHNPIDPFHLQLYDDDTLTVVPPFEAPMPPKPLPRPPSPQ